MSKRTPTNILELRGSFKKNPKRRRVDPEPAGDLGDAPDHLTESEAGCWRELVAMAPPGVLTAGDRWAVEIAARLMAEYRGAAEFRSARMARLQSALGALGLSPADRARVASKPAAKPSENPFLSL